MTFDTAVGTFNERVNKKENCIKMSGLPFKASEKEMRDFFLPEAKCVSGSDFVFQVFSQLSQIFSQLSQIFSQLSQIFSQLSQIFFFMRETDTKTARAKS